MQLAGVRSTLKAGYVFVLPVFVRRFASETATQLWDVTPQIANVQYIVTLVLLHEEYVAGRISVRQE